ncbi:helix-turn-helix domain-containing protein [Kordia sp. YSTF-M3]|uniref:Helix-turn-helix domain-containing protein n=1 Tax=Kordia aestuariivivens TaxID=2759037 RepID=A0ABR7Q9E8_9FLAO|nr:helix-turn-helix domain-containing protein [Kordia aestuariivivens]MBC8755180.1 helix-turn-helix domain-containing protein [Kordia aestuariivivens]
MSLKGQELNTMNDSLVSKEIQLFISYSDSIHEIEELIYDTFDQKKDTLLGLAYCNSFLERGKKQQNYEVQYFSSYQIAYINYMKSDHKQAVRYAHMSVKVAEKMQDTISSFNSNILLGSSWYVLGNYDEALQSYLVAKELATKLQDLQSELICLANIANTRAKLDRYEDALKGYNSILNILDEKDKGTFDLYVSTYLSSLLGKVLCLTGLGNLEAAEKACAKGIALAEENGLNRFVGDFNINLGSVHYEKEAYYKSLGFLREGKKILRNHGGLQNNLYITDFFIARNLYKLEELEEAASLLDGIFESIGEKLITDRVEEMYELAKRIAEIQNNKEKQIFYLDKLNKINAIKTERESNAKDLLHKDDLKDIVTENEKLANEKSKSIVDKNIILIGASILFVVVLLVFLSYHKRTKLKEQKFLTIIENISKNTIAKKQSQNPKIKDEKANSILEKLQELENTDFYLSKNATLHTTAKLLNTNTTYLSKALNDVKKQSFNQYLNKLRIDYVLVKLKEDSVFRSYTIHAISEEIGYKSATTFIKEFKNKTGLNPSYYIKKIQS